MLSISLIVAFGIALTLLGVLTGVLGGNRSQRARLGELESYITSIDERLTREQKKRAGVTLQENRKDHMAEAQAIAAAHKAQAPAASRMPGRANGITLSE